jgi:hypothetical protein
LNAFKAVLKNYKPGVKVFGFMVLFGGIGVASILLSKAVTPTASFEAELGTLANCATSITDAGASGGGAVRFGGSTCGGGSAVGAVLPISYSLGSLSGTVRYVATNGSDTSGTGSVSAPYATLSKAVSVATANDSVVVRGGTYRQGNVSISTSKTLKIMAYPGEIPVFNGAQVASGWVTDGSLQYIPYTPRPATDGSGISFTTGQNLTGDGVGKYPDQAWLGATQLRQVSAKTSVVDGTFWVDRTANRLYMTPANAGQGGVEVSQANVFLTVNSPNTSIEGLRVTRYSNTASDYGVIKFQTTADNSLMRNVEISDTAFIAVLYDGTSNRNDGGRMLNVTVTRSNWMGISAVFTDNLTLDRVKLSDMNQFNEFTFSPQSGALKTSRTWYTKVLNSEITGNNSHGVWFDQSNYDAQVANNTITNNNGSALFFEISDNLLLINNYIHSTTGQPVKLAGSSGLKLINNTIVGGPDTVGIYVDNRSKPGCADPSQPLCTDSYNSDRDSSRTLPATMDWMPRVDLMLNNIIAYPKSNGFCGVLTTVCATQANSTATVTLQSIFHKAEPARGIPETYINGNVYANGTGYIFSYNSPQGRHTTTSALGTAMAASPVLISGFESTGRYGNTYVNTDGSPTANLTALHSQASPVPTNSVINQYLPAGTRHYGVTSR